MSNFADLLPKKEVSLFNALTKKYTARWCNEIYGTTKGREWQLSIVQVNSPAVFCDDIVDEINVFEVDGKLGEILGYKWVRYHSIFPFPDWITFEKECMYNYFIEFDRIDDVIKKFYEIDDKKVFYDYLKNNFPLVCGLVKMTEDEKKQYKMPFKYKPQIFKTFAGKYICHRVFDGDRKNAKILYKGRLALKVFYSPDDIIPVI